MSEHSASRPLSAGLTREIAARFELRFFGIDVAVTAQGDCFVLDWNHLPHGVVGVPGFVDAVVDLVLERAGSRKRRRPAEQSESRGASAPVGAGECVGPKDGTYANAAPSI